MELLNRARAHLARGETGLADQLFRQVIANDRHNREALEQLVMICLQRRQHDEALDFLRQLVSSYPTEPLYCNRLATLLERRGRGAEAIDCYRRLLAARPAMNNIRYNLARLLKRQGRPQEALQEYRDCLARKIERPEEVLSNISIIYSDMHRHQEAHQSLQAALAHNPDHIPALYNLAQLQEEEGDWAAAGSSFRRILQLEPLHAGALAHIANGERNTTRDNPMIGQLQSALGRDELAQDEREELLYASGKVHDDCGLFETAFDSYQLANQLSRNRCGAYDPAAQEQLVDQLISTCDEHWLNSIEPVSDTALIFICGMFRSGTTLLEQILAAHPDLTPGGELNFFQRSLKPFPGGIVAADSGQLEALGRDYIGYLEQHFPAGARVTNKRPDNFLCQGLLKALFPNVRIINTLRQPLDNCLSLFFQPLDAAQRHANGLLDAGHYYLQYRRLLAHWHQLPGGNMLDISYESLVEEPRDSIERVLSFLQLDWHEDCLEFHNGGNRVRTASVHQVRRPLYQSSRDRWRNYANRLEELRDYLRSADDL